MFIKSINQFISFYKPLLLTILCEKACVYMSIFNITIFKVIMMANIF